MNLLRKINRHIKLIERKIKREHSENKASFPVLCSAHCHWLKASHLRSAIEGRLLKTRAKGTAENEGWWNSLCLRLVSNCSENPVVWGPCPVLFLPRCSRSGVNTYVASQLNIKSSSPWTQGQFIKQSNGFNFATPWVPQNNTTGNARNQRKLNHAFSQYLWKDSKGTLKVWWSWKMS